MNTQILIENPAFVKKIYCAIENYFTRCDVNFMNDPDLFGEIVKFLVDLDLKMQYNSQFIVEQFEGKQNGTREYILVGAIGGSLTQLKICIGNLIKYQSRPNRYSSRIEGEKKLILLYILDIYRMCHTICYMCDFKI